VLLRDAGFGLEESYWTGLHTSSEEDATDVRGFVTNSLSSGGIEPYALSVTETAVLTTHTSQDTALWMVNLTVLDADIETLRRHHASAAFITFLEGAAGARGGAHANSGFQTRGALTTGPPYNQTAASHRTF